MTDNKYYDESNSEFNDELIKKDVFSSKKPVLLYFFSLTCGPCRVQSSILKNYMMKHDEDVRLLKVNIAGSPELTRYFNIKSVPTILYVKDGEILGRISGIHDEDALNDLLTSNFSYK